MENLNQVLDLDSDFTRCMIFVTIGLIITFLVIIPYFEQINLPFKTSRKLTYTHENQEIPVKNLSFDKLPAVIYQSYNNNTVVNSKLINNLNNTILNNEEFDIYIFNENESRKFIETNYDSKLAKIYDKLSITQKNNLWIYCLLYTKGGIYMDINLESIEPLLNVLSITSKNLLFTIEDNKISNKFISSPPELPMFKELIDSYYTNNIQTLNYSVLTYHSDNIKFHIDNNTIKLINSDEIIFRILN
jgi:mannosyltransferase OCH1-like enzyme